ncbi:Protein CBR-RDY-2 [Caenorhabditis briggsae]|uniref:Protein CBR-RDY-2 n=1 Tax=Caenorhabditis briggsae TaxID=6238 RepID=A8XCS4_CAEBR|nr:Protein CBR-RDY-2 [Caenorhabditis briggsae]CAP30442.2 Protein CBR-RDY-2 [Caenorhabditis briggsae]
MSDQANRVVYVEQRRHIVVNSPPQSPTPLHHFPVNRQYSGVAETSSNPPPLSHPPLEYRTKHVFTESVQWNCLLYSDFHSGELLQNVTKNLSLSRVILAIVSMILILTAPGACFSRYLNGQSISREVSFAIPTHFSTLLNFQICPGQNSIFPMNADRWSNALHFQGRGQNVYGQVALICITLAFGLITVGVSCVTLALNSILTYPQILISGLSMVAFIVSGGVETWYATGYDHMEFFIQAVGNGVFSGCAGIPGCQIQFVVKGWAVAAAFYFLGALLYVIDMALIFISREK